MTILRIDHETRSRVDLPKSNVYRYVECPDFRILMTGWALDDEPVQAALGHDEVAEIPYLWDDSVELVAHNAAFERITLSALAWELGILKRGTYLNPERFTCTQALAAEHGYPQKLEYLAKQLGVDEKDSAGTRLINLFSKPNRKGTFNDATTHPAEWAEFVAYCVQDVETLRQAHKALPGWPTATEKRLYAVDQMINDRGIPTDVDMAERAVAAADDNRLAQELEVMALTGVSNPGSNPQMLGWLKAQGLKVNNLQAATVTDLLAGDELEQTPRRVLELRQELALVAAKKYQAAVDRVNPDGRLRGSFQFFGAHTGRWAGRGVQLQNLPSATLRVPCAAECDEDSPEHAGHIDAFVGAHVLDLKMGLGASAHTLKALVRAMFTGPFTVVDYSAIEARVVAWLAGEQWALDAFAAGRDIYVETAERMGGLTRKEGKVAVLALGYNGGINSLRVMGADGSDDQLQFLVRQWRSANENICNLWYYMQDSFRNGGPVGDLLEVVKDGTDRHLVLPSGRSIVYHSLKERWVEKWGKRVRQISFSDPKGPGIRTDTYGGKLVENVTQAVARDVLAAALIALQDEGYPVVGHVHDEILVQGSYPVAQVAAVMNRDPGWATGLPLAAAGFTTARYRKD